MNKPSWFDSYISGNLSAGFALHYPKAECIGTGYVWQLGPALSMQVLFDEWGTVLVELCESHGDAIEHHSIAYELKGIVHQDLPVVIGLVSEQEKAWTKKHGTHDWRANIADEIIVSAKARKNLSTTCTGGGFDYISRVLWADGPEMILHAAGDEPASPDTLSEACEVWLFLTDWSLSYHNVLRFYFDTAVQALDFMAGFEMAKEGF